jgi:hypothetical protein
MARKKVPTAAIIAGVAWDGAWKFLAIRRAIKLRQFRWIAPLLVVNSVGLLPMLYLWKLSKRQAQPGD